MRYPAPVIVVVQAGKAFGGAHGVPGVTLGAVGAVDLVAEEGGAVGGGAEGGEDAV